MDDQLKSHMVGHFTRLFSIDGSNKGLFLYRGRFSNLSVVARCVLEGAVADAGIRTVLFKMAPLKALGIDKYHAKFYQVH